MELFYFKCKLSVILTLLCHTHVLMFPTRLGRPNSTRNQEMVDLTYIFDEETVYFEDHNKFKLNVTAGKEFGENWWVQTSKWLLSDVGSAVIVLLGFEARRKTWISSLWTYSWNNHHALWDPLLSRYWRRWIAITEMELKWRVAAEVANRQYAGQRRCSSVQKTFIE